MIRFFFVFTAMLLGLSIAIAQEAAAPAPRYDEAKEVELTQKAKKRIYPGGRDEEDLKVQSQLATPARKLSPQAEVKEEASEE